MLKPEREGGGNNFYGDEIPKKLDEICGGDGKEKNAYILMDRITPLEHLNVQLRPGAQIEVYFIFITTAFSHLVLRFCLSHFLGLHI